MEEYYLLTFESTHGAIATDHFLKPLGCTIMPVPRFISASCGISIRINPEQKAEIEEVFRKESNLKNGEYTYYHIVKNSEIQIEKIEMQ